MGLFDVSDLPTEDRIPSGLLVDSGVVQMQKQFNEVSVFTAIRMKRKYH